MYIMDTIDEPFTLQYINDNIIGIFLLILTFFIIYFVDHISRINAMIYAMPSPIPGISSQSLVTYIHKPPKNKKK
jgi:hypothetical protein